VSDYARPIFMYSSTIHQLWKCFLLFCLPAERVNSLGAGGLAFVFQCSLSLRCLPSYFLASSCIKLVLGGFNYARALCLVISLGAPRAPAASFPPFRIMQRKREIRSPSHSLTLSHLRAIDISGAREASIKGRQSARPVSSAGCISEPAARLALVMKKSSQLTHALAAIAFNLVFVQQPVVWCTRSRFRPPAAAAV
jgi:hypothetical protein